MNTNFQDLNAKDTAWLQGIYNTIAESQALRQRLDSRHHAIKVPTTIPSIIMAQAQPKKMWPLSDITHPGNWPVDAVIGIETESFHRDFGNRSGGKRIHYFSSEAEFKKWESEEWAHIANIDFAYSLHITVYEWDWGPEHKGTRYL